MRPIARRMLACFVAVCATVCVASIALWVRSHWVADAWDFDRPYIKTSLGFFRGDLVVSRERFNSLTIGPGPSALQPRTGYREFDGFSFLSLSTISLTFWEAHVPLLFVALLTAIPPAFWAWRYRKRRGVPRGFDVQINSDGTQP